MLSKSKSTFIKLSLLLVIFISALMAYAQESNLEITFTKIKKAGDVHVALWGNAGSFLGKSPYKGKIVSVENGTAKAIFRGVPYGQYAVSTFLDTNGNGKLDTGFIGIPKEPYAFSNNPSAMFGPPKFEEASFIINKETTQIQIDF